MSKRAMAATAAAFCLSQGTLALGEGAAEHSQQVWDEVARQRAEWDRQAAERRQAEAEREAARQAQIDAQRVAEYNERGVSCATLPECRHAEALDP